MVAARLEAVAVARDGKVKGVRIKTNRTSRIKTDKTDKTNKTDRIKTNKPNRTNKTFRKFVRNHLNGPNRPKVLRS